MFNYLYKQYKTEVLKVDIWKSLKELKFYEKLFLVIVFLGCIMSAIFSLLGINAGMFISLGLIVIGFILLLLFRNRKTEQKRIVDEIVRPYANKRMEKVIKILLSFDIDVKDEKQLDDLISLAQKEKLTYDFEVGFRNAFKGVKTYIFLPILTIFLSEFFKDVELTVLLYRAILFMLICSCIVLFISAFSFNINDILNPDIRNLNYFISDIEDIKVFPQKARKLVENITTKNV